jgi:calcium/calmodulin-dependent protein kinase I
MGNNIKKRHCAVHAYWEIKEKIGSGSFAVVHRAVNRQTGEEAAVKIIKKEKLNKEEIAIVHNEIEIMHKIHFPTCVELKEVFETKKKIYVVMEYLAGGELFDRIVQKGSFSEQEASYIIQQVASALHYLHHHGITHRDLKPENILYASKDANSHVVKVTDFGLAKFQSARDAENSLMTRVGTPGFVSPEMLNTAKGNAYTSAVDLWALGVILYILLCGFPPFYASSTVLLYQLIRDGEYDFPAPYWNDISKSAKDLVRKLLCVDPTKRLTAAEVLEHPFIKKGSKVSNKGLGTAHCKRLRLLQIRRRLRRGVHLVLAINRFVQIAEEIRSSPPSPTVASTTVRSNSDSNESNKPSIATSSSTISSNSNLSNFGTTVKPVPSIPSISAIASQSTTDVDTDEPASNMETAPSTLGKQAIINFQSSTVDDEDIQFPQFHTQSEDNESPPDVVNSSDTYSPTAPLELNNSINHLTSSPAYNPIATATQ